MVERAAAGDVDVFWMVGGNFLETLPDTDRSRRALGRPGLRIHHDIVLSSAMLAESEAILIPPAATATNPKAEARRHPPSADHLFA
jgi:hypothetical protein